MTYSQTITCPKCNAAAESGAVFCTNCGAHLSKAAVEATVEIPQTASAPAQQSSAPDAPRCKRCQSLLDAGAMYCTNCGARAASSVPASVTAASQAGASAIDSSARSTNTAQPSVSSSMAARLPQEEKPATAAPAVAATAAAVAVQPAYQSTSKPVTKYAPASLGEASGARKSGPLVIAVLLLLVIIGTAVLWLRPSGAATAAKVLILTPQESSVTLEPNATAQLGVTVQGDDGAGVTWKILENYGGKVDPAGVTVEGQRFVYKAAYHAGSTPGDYHVVATSLANKESRVSITVHVER